MQAHGRHIMLNCEGEGCAPPVTVEGLCAFLADRLDSSQLGKYTVLSAGDVLTAIEDYEKGVRHV